MIYSYEIRTILWVQGRQWALFRNHLGTSTCLYTAATHRQCVDYLRTRQHQRVLPKGMVLP